MRYELSILAVFAVSCADPPRQANPALEPSTPKSSESAGSATPAIAIGVGKDDSFDTTITSGSQVLRKNGEGLCEWGFFKIDLYRAVLYAERPSNKAESLVDSDQTLVFHLLFSRSLSQTQLQDAYRASIAANSDTGQFDDCTKQLSGLMRDVAEGDSYTFVCHPRRGLVVQRNNEVLGTIASQPFRELFTRLYLGNKPPTKALRKALLGQ